MKLTKEEIDLLTCPPGRRDKLFFDAEVKGFCMRVTKDGAKTFLFQYRRGKAVRRYKIGPYGECTPFKARVDAQVLRGRTLAGEDPVAEKAATAAAEAEAKKAKKLRAQADAVTLGVLIGNWETKQLAHRSARYRAEAPRALRAGLPKLLNLPADTIDATMVRRALDAIPKPRKSQPAAPGAKKRGKGLPSVPVLHGETMARRVRSYGSALFGWASKRGLVPGNPFADLPMESRDVARDRVLTDAELGEVMAGHRQARLALVPIPSVPTAHLAARGRDRQACVGRARAELRRLGAAGRTYEEQQAPPGAPGGTGPHHPRDCPAPHRLRPGVHHHGHDANFRIRQRQGAP